MRAAVASDRLIARMWYDKKVQNDRLRLVLPTAIGAAEIVETDEPAVADALLGIGAAAS